MKRRVTLMCTTCNLKSPILNNYFEQLIQLKYTLGSAILLNPYHIPLLSNRLRRSLRNFIPEVYEEITNAFDTYIPFTEGSSCSRTYHLQRYADIKNLDWVPIKFAADIVPKIVCHASNRIFVGYPLCK